MLRRHVVRSTGRRRPREAARAPYNIRSAARSFRWYTRSRSRITSSPSSSRPRPQRPLDQRRLRHAQQDHRVERASRRPAAVARACRACGGCPRIAVEQEAAPRVATRQPLAAPRRPSGRRPPAARRPSRPPPARRAEFPAATAARSMSPVEIAGHAQAAGQAAPPGSPCRDPGAPSRTTAQAAVSVSRAAHGSGPSSGSPRSCASPAGFRPAGSCPSRRRPRSAARCRRSRS